ncbi:anaerobic glycerol-3-phosphate dehydrogenase subunit A [Candidatus Harpocratesius sp.]
MELTQDFDAIIIGGGISGAGIARDLALRGLKVILFEKKDLAEGTTGRCHGLLHSGARYVSTDPQAANECAKENEILRKIATHIIDSCGGYFIALTDEEVDYGDRFIEYCANAEIEIEEITPEKFLQLEPNCNPRIKRVFRVNDAYIDPFLLTYYNALDAKQHGAIIKTYTLVEHLILTEKEIVGVRIHDIITNEFTNIYGKIVINATGPWAALLESDLKLKNSLQIVPTKGTLLVYKKRLVSSVINRLRLPGDGDIIVPSHQSVILGTNAIPVNERDLDQLKTTYEEIDQLEHLGEEMLPIIKSARLIRYYTGARPLVKSNLTPQNSLPQKISSNNSSLYNSSRQFKIVDYSNEGYSGFITVFGGKLTTYRLLAEKVSDYVCHKLGIYEKCSTDTIPLPGADLPYTKKEIQELFHIDERRAADLSLKWGSFMQEMGNLCITCLDSAKIETNVEIKGRIYNRIICECEKVTENELKWVKEHLFVQKIDDYRRRTRQGMGICQGQFCLFKVAEMDLQWSNKTHKRIMEELKEALEERWKTEDLVDELQKRQIKLAKYMYILGGNL